MNNGIAYVPAADTPRTGGYATVNVANPDAPVLISASNSQPNVLASGGFATNGSGLGILVGMIGPTGPSDVVELMDVSDPTNTTNYLTEFNVPTAPESVSIAAGIAFVADGLSGLQVVNYEPFDTEGVPPKVSISSPISGSSVPEGTAIPVSISASDDVQVRNVEILVNGQVAVNLVSTPFDYVVIAPTLASGAISVSIQVQATDTGGNSTLSNTLTYSLVKDTSPPTIVGIDPATGAVWASA